MQTGQHYLLYLHYRDIIREKLGPEEASRAKELGKSMSLEQVIDYALAGRDS
jgi:hypothetical protein